MGTDIHMLMQRRYKDKHGLDAWRSEREINICRNYEFFGCLADVRNGKGFASIDIYKPVKALTSKRGFPEDLEEGVYNRGDWAYMHLAGYKNHRDDSLFGLGYHDFGWVTLDEIAAYKFPVIHHIGLVERDVYLETVPGEQPSEWCGDCSSHNMVKWDSREGGKIPDDATHIWYAWDTDGADCLPGEIKELLKNEKDPTSIRLIFGFDS